MVTFVINGGSVGVIRRKNPSSVDEGETPPSFNLDENTKRGEYIDAIATSLRWVEQNPRLEQVAGVLEKISEMRTKIGVVDNKLQKRINLQNRWHVPFIK